MRRKHIVAAGIAAVLLAALAWLLWPRELDERLGLGALKERHRTDPSTGRTRQVPLPDLFRQSISSPLAGYENTNDAERLAAEAHVRSCSG